MKIFTTTSIKQLDALTIENEPISSIDLMERASRALVKAIAERWDADTPMTVFAGPGNNGGDALAVSRLLSEKGYKVEVYLFNTTGTLSADCNTNKEKLAGIANIIFHEVTSQFTPPTLTASHVVIDGLFGSGLNKALSGGFAAVVKYINASSATVVAIDIPSGLMGEDNTYNVPSGIIRANLTLSLQLPKLAFLFAENEPYVGEWQLLEIGLSEDAMEDMDTDFQLLENEDMPYMLKSRNKFAHKGDFGRALLIAGSQGMAGASVLAARACLRSGVGLLTVHVTFCNNNIVQTSVPEAMTLID
ncbi:MAG: NAD(P)H-hydrate epimerase, partial [Angelakisella sp.]